MKTNFEHKPGIYKITNIVNNKMYIGSSRNVFTRISSHKSKLKTNNHINKYLQKSYNKHGIENFIYEIIVYCQEEELIFLEEYYINLYDSSNYEIGYNIISFSKGIQIHSLETKNKISKGNKGKRKGIKPAQACIDFITEFAKLPKTEQHKQNLSKSHLGRKRESFSEEWKLNLGLAHSKKIDVYNLNFEIVYQNITVTELCKILNISNSIVNAAKTKKHVLKKEFLIIDAGNILIKSEYSRLNKVLWSKKLRKSNGRPIKIYKDDIEHLFDSGTCAAEFLKVSTSHIHKSAKKNIKIQGWCIEYK